jgi:hypothetical protein
MKHTVRIERHVIRDLLASAGGGAFIAALIQKSGWAALLCVVLVGILLITERADIEEEEQ